jgi:hypothetical protein
MAASEVVRGRCDGIGVTAGFLEIMILTANPHNYIYGSTQGSRPPKTTSAAGPEGRG